MSLDSRRNCLRQWRMPASRPEGNYNGTAPGVTTIRAFPVRGNRRCFRAPTSASASSVRAATISTRRIDRHARAFPPAITTILTTTSSGVKVCVATMLGGTSSDHRISSTRIAAEHLNLQATFAAVATAIRGTTPTRRAMISRRDCSFPIASSPRSTHCWTKNQSGAVCCRRSAVPLAGVCLTQNPTTKTASNVAASIRNACSMCTTATNATSATSQPAPLLWHPGRCSGT